MNKFNNVSLILFFLMAFFPTTMVGNSVKAASVLNINKYGATANDQTDDTKAIQSAINAAKTGDTVLIPKGNYYINPNIGLSLKSNSTLTFEQGSKLTSLATSKEFYNIIKVWGVSNVKITGYPTIVGDRYIHKGSGGEHGMGISIQSANNVYVENANITNCWGDAIYIGSIRGRQLYSKDVSLKNVNLNGNRRQGISVISAINLTIDNPRITNTNGTNPQSGIDFEPNFANQYLQNITVTNPYIQNNKNNGIQFYFGLGPFNNPVSINIVNSSNVKNNGNQNIKLYSNGLGKVRGKITVDGKALFNK